MVPLLFCLPAGQHRSLGTMVSKVQSLKLDTSVWSNEIVQVGVAVSCFFFFFFCEMILIRIPDDIPRDFTTLSFTNKAEINYYVYMF